jgi:D-inositol-3-phosphate glycosyltransferase
MRCSEVVLASCTVEASQLTELYGADPARVRVVAPGVDHAFFAPGYRPQARRALGLPEGDPLLLFVGRIQPLKGADVAIRALATLRHDLRAGLVIVGGPSGPRGVEHLKHLEDLTVRLGVEHRVHFVEPQPHELLSTYYRAADVCVVPSRSESFGLVALEAAACGTPVVAAAVGGLTTLVDHGRTGFLVEDPTPATFAEAVSRVLVDPVLAQRLSAAAVIRARGYTWSKAAGLLRATYEELASERLAACV